jgi:hypothetical protein
MSQAVQTTPPLSREALTLLISLHELRNKSSTAMWNLAMKCKNPSHELTPPVSFDNPAKILKKMHLLDKSGNIPEATKTLIVTSQLITNLDKINEKCLPILRDYTPLNHYHFTCSIL